MVYIREPSTTGNSSTPSSAGRTALESRRWSRKAKRVVGRMHGPSLPPYVVKYLHRHEGQDVVWAVFWH